MRLVLLPCCLTNAAYNSLPKSILNTWRVLLYSCVWQVEVATAYCGWVHSDTPFTWRLLSHNYVQLKLKIVQFSRLPLPCPSTSKIPPPCWPWMSNFKRKNPPPSSPLQMITNELKEYIIQGWLLYVIRPSFRSVFVFSINSLILSGFPLTSFHLADTSLSAFSWLYTLAFAVVRKHHEMSLIYNYSHF